MNLTNTPSKVQIPFANATAYKYTIPVASQIGTDVRKASYADGFPPLTMEPISSGGVAPYGQDFNGVLNQLSAGLRWEQSNTPFKFDSEFCASIGGYPLGAKLLSADNTHYWINQAADNTVNPDTVGTNWVAGESIAIGSFPNADKWTTARTLSFTGDVTGSGAVDGSGNVSFTMTGVQAAKWTNARTLSFTGDVTGSGSVDGSGNVSFAMTGVKAAKWTTPRTLSFTGDVTGSGSVDGSNNVSIPLSLTAVNVVSILTGIVTDGGTIPLPAGYTESQCKWIASSNHLVNDNDTVNNIYCYTTGRVVTVNMEISGASTANYIIIGVK